MADNANQDSDDLEALFDSIVAANVVDEAAAQGEKKPVIAAENVDASRVIQEVGHMARALHDTLRELGLTKEIEKAASSIPDARDRLNYVATMTQQAAEKVLNATEAAQPVMEMVGAEAQRLAGQWDLLFEQKLDLDQFRAMVEQTHAFLANMPKQTKVVNGYLIEIMMAQDFQDLTGQVIRKVIELTQNMEKQLLQLLLETAPPELKADWSKSGLLDGPVINPRGRTDVVTNQKQVDELLESLGF